MININKTKIFFIITITIAIIIAYLSIKPSGYNVGINGFDKIEHLIIYFILSLMAYLTIKNKSVAFLISGTYGLFLEIFQIYVPNRNFSILDLFMNYFGAWIVFLIPKSYLNIIIKNDS